MQSLAVSFCLPVSGYCWCKVVVLNARVDSGCAMGDTTSTRLSRSIHSHLWDAVHNGITLAPIAQEIGAGGVVVPR